MAQSAGAVTVVGGRQSRGSGEPYVLAGWHPFEATKSSLQLGSIAHLIRTSMARNAKQINAPVGAEVFSLANNNSEKYGSRASNKPRDFNYIKNPYQIPVVQRSRENRGERIQATLFAGSAVQSFAAKGPQNVAIFTSSHRKRES
jgi:hypothetical protein